MPWEKSSDTAATHPLVMRLASQPMGKRPRVEDLRLRAVYGFVHACSNWSAAQETDYVVPLGTVQLMGGPAWEWFLDQAVMAGLMKPTRSKRDLSWKIAEDPGLFHIQSKDARAWRNARDRDIANPALRNPVRFRDGDACRYCRRIVQWSDRKSDIKGEYDHRPASKPAKSIENLYVSCKSCNSKRGDLPLGEADALYPPYPPPAVPYYGPQSRALLTKAGYDLPAPGNYEQPATQPTPGARPGTQPDTATPSRPSQTRHRPQRPTDTPSADPVPGQPQSRETASEEHASPTRDADPPPQRRSRRAPRRKSSPDQPP